MANLLPGCRLFEIDFSGSEAVDTGWYSGDPAYIWLAKLGVHAGLASHVLNRPYDPTWPVPQIAAYFKDIKQSQPVLYDRCKRTTHGDNYGLTEFGMVKNFPETFPTLAIARKFKAAYRAMAPKLGQFQTDVREIAYDLNYLGGTQPPLAYSNKVGQIFARNPRLKVHPFGYKHWFWAVLGFRPIPYNVYLKRQRKGEPVTTIGDRYFAITLGEDAKRVIAFFSQSTTAGKLKEVMLRLCDPEHPSYIGDAYYGRTPFRAPIHDSLLFEIPNRVWDRVLEKVYREMMRPCLQLPLDWVTAEEKARYGLGEYLATGVEGKAGADWLNMTTLPSPTLEELGVSQDKTYLPDDDYSGYGSDDEELEASLGTVA